jgi:hypothetical protein
MAEVQVTRTELSSPTIDDPERRVIMIQYRSGELPPRFLYVNKADYTKEKEAELIREDIKKRTETAPPETIEV